MPTRLGGFEISRFSMRIPKLIVFKIEVDQMNFRNFRQSYFFSQNNPVEIIEKIDL